MKVVFFSLGVALMDEPITRVVTLLEELKGRIESDGKAEQLAYDKYACWCENTTDRKAQAIHGARKSIGNLGNQVLELKGKVAKKTSVIQENTEKIASEQDALNQMTEMRAKENANYKSVKAEMVQTLQALQNAIEVLMGAGTGTKSASLLQAPQFMALSATLSRVLANGHLNQKQVSLAQRLLSTFDPDATYSPQSATIIGILKDMYKSFTSDLEESTMSEATTAGQYEELAHTKEQLIATAQESLSKAEQHKAEALQRLADTDQSLLDTTEQLESDVKFFDTTKAACTDKAAAWTTRRTNRVDELKGIEKALEILEENRELFKKSIKPGMETFIQTSRAPRNKAFNILRREATKAHSLRLATLAATVKQGHFADVIKMIDEMVKELVEEENDDKVKRDECVADRHKLNEDIKVEKHDNEVKNTHIDNKDMQVQENNATMEANAKTIQETNNTLASMLETRTEENSEFKQAKADDEQAVTVLDEVIEALKEFHNKSALVQEPEFEVSEDQAPDTKFSDKSNRKQESGGIVSMLTMIQNDLKNEITNGMKEEEEEQKTYESSKADLDALVERLEEANVNLKESNATLQGEIDELGRQIETNDGEISGYDEELEGMAKGCDWLMKNFQMRRDRRRDESEALKNAKSLLAGAELNLVAKNKYDDDVLPSLTFSSLSFLQRN